jgi:hypothetical protein
VARCRGGEQVLRPSFRPVRTEKSRVFFSEQSLTC